MVQICLHISHEVKVKEIDSLAAEEADSNKHNLMSNKSLQNNSRAQPWWTDKYVGVAHRHSHKYD